MKYLIFLLLACASCTENRMAKNYGGTMSVTLPPGQKLIVATWKDANLWYLTRDMRADETPESYTFAEDSNYGVLQGSIHFQEQSKK